MKRILNWLSIVFAATVITSLPLAGANATTLYDESVSGDLTNMLTGPYLSLVQGENSFIGSVAFDISGPDMDAFRFEVPIGFQLTSATMTYSTEHVIDLVGSLWFLYRYQGVVLRPSISYGSIRACGDIAVSWCAGSPSPGQWFASALPIDSGSYILWNDSLGRADFGGVVTYRLDLYLTPTNVIEPGSFALLAMGLAGLGLSRRRKAV